MDVTRYIKLQRLAAVPTISYQGTIADRHKDKARMLVDTSFPPPTQYDGDEWQEGQADSQGESSDSHTLKQDRPRSHPSEGSKFLQGLG